MFELAGDLLAVLDAGHRVAVVTVSSVLGSAPRTLGSSMAVDDEGRAIGSISGGCVEAQAYGLAEELLATGLTAEAHFGFDDEAAFAAGLTCGGQMRVFGTTVSADDTAVVEQLRRAAAGRAAGIAVVVGGSDEATGLVVTTDQGAQEHGPGPRGEVRARVARRLLPELEARLHSGDPASLEIDCDGVLIEALFLVHAAPPRMIVFGAVDFSAALAVAARPLGYRVTICDARPVFATPERFPAADEVVVEWPHRYLAAEAAAGRIDTRTVLAVLTHDEKFDVPVLRLALSLEVAYVGAMGSRRTHERRLLLLREAGVSDEMIDRLHSPIGLDLGAATPAETAVSIVAEVVAARTGASGGRLRDGAGPIHAVPGVEALRARQGPALP